MTTSELEHERVEVVTGARSGFPVIVAVHSTVLGQAVGGCRLWNYADWREALEDALRLSEAMTLKCALAGLPHGGGKAVIALPPGLNLSPQQRREVFLDLGDLVESLEGRYGTGEDVGTTAEDMLIVRERTSYVFCLPASQGGVGEPSEPTAIGVFAAIRAVMTRLFGSPDLKGRRVSIVGLGQVGSRLARRLSEGGASLIVTDIDESKKALARELGADWAEPSEAVLAEADVLVPAALGGTFTPEVVDLLRCAAIVGPANNQLAEDNVAELLSGRGILWAPDFVVNAGGAIYGTLADTASGNNEQVTKRVEAIGETLAMVLEVADRDGVTPLVAAMQLADDRINAGRSPRVSVSERAAPSI